MIDTISIREIEEKADNVYESVIVVAKRARQIGVYGKEPMVQIDSDKPTVLALREIAEGLVTQKLLDEVESDFIEQVEEEIPIVIMPQPEEE